MKGLSQDDIKKRFFICSRHFSVESYKSKFKLKGFICTNFMILTNLDKDSRSLNTTAVPNLNLANLSDLQFSKAYHLEREMMQTSLPAIQSDEASKFKILNSTFKKPIPSSSILPVKILNQNSIEDVVATIIEQIPSKRTASKLIKSSNPKRIKTQQELIFKKSDVEVAFQKKEVKRGEESSCTENTPESPLSIIRPHQHENKLLALIEVTPSQYHDLNQKFSAAERTAKIEALISLFVDNDNVGQNGNENCKYYFFIAKRSARMILYS